MNRRGFLGALLGGTLGLALDPERLLWMPGRKTFFLPSVVPVAIGTTHAMSVWLSPNTPLGKPAGVWLPERFTHADGGHITILTRMVYEQ